MQRDTLLGKRKAYSKLLSSENLSEKLKLQLYLWQPQSCRHWKLLPSTLHKLLSLVNVTPSSVWTGTFAKQDFVKELLLKKLYRSNQCNGSTWCRRATDRGAVKENKFDLLTNQNPEFSKRLALMQVIKCIPSYSYFGFILGVLDFFKL